MSETMARPQPWLGRMEGRDPDEDHRATTPLELLFDLTLVVAVARAADQLHHALTEGEGASALLGYVIVFLAFGGHG